ncbi:MAG: glycogen/starch/alpha-glucan family phosphorylase [Bacilli bacterium]|jgi:starch phosphorylase|nr:glycogen/starch/alpha-glucan family phosphorylase [Bacilli bacterium]
MEQTLKTGKAFRDGFKKEFTERFVGKYGRDPQNSSAQEQFDILGTFVRDYANVNGKKNKEEVREAGQKQVIYFSMEFLLGKLLTTNLYNLGILDDVKLSLKEMGIDYAKLEEEEPDAGLGNGGLGRLAACFMDSAASLSLPVHGNCIRYEYGFFRQKIRNGKQEEYPDTWLTNGYPWEIRKPSDGVIVRFYGNPETYRVNGNLKWRTANSYAVLAVPYDVPMIGYHNKVTNTLRLWYAEPCEEELPNNADFTQYLKFIRDITHGLYPDDSTEEGKLLRLRQQYFLVSSGMQFACNKELALYKTLDKLYEHYNFHLNDTHPILSIPELMRILMDEHDYSWEDAYYIVSKCFAFTNHTVMPEALEKWPCRYIASVAPRVYMIIEEINRRILQKMRENKVPEDAEQNCLILKDGNVNMCQLAIHVAYSVNGVAALHTKILEEQTFHDLYKIYPEKFSNKTNGISHRRFLLVSNPRLSDYIESLIGDSFIKDPEKLSLLSEYCDGSKEHNAVYEKINAIKRANKLSLVDYVKIHNDMELSPDAIFDSQIKRLHAYKRQLLNVFRIIHLYQRMKADSSFRIRPHVYLFGAKAAPSYTLAKKIIELILAVSKTIDQDPDISRYMKVVFIENYGVSNAQIIIPASDISEQISLAGKEASGTSNMKFMMNGAITLGTLDGANIEIANRVGPDNAVIFGMREEEVKQVKFQNSYNPWDLYNSDERIKAVIDSLTDGITWSKDKGQFQIIYDDIMYHNDEFMVLKDFASYLEASKRIESWYDDRNGWGCKALANIAASGWFSSDRTISEYNRDIWHLKKIH